MRIRLHTTMAGPAGNYQAGQVVDLPQGQAEELVLMRYAVAMDGPAPVRPPVESAAMKQVETAVAVGPARRRQARAAATA